MTYKILDINQKDGWVKIEVTFDDGEIYQKRMMAPLDSEDTIKAAVEKWLSDYLATRDKSVKYDPKTLKNKSYTISESDMLAKGSK